MDEVLFRLASLSDVPALVRLRAAFLAEVAEANAADPSLRTALEQYFAAALPAGEFVAVVGEVGNEIVGTGGLVYHRHAPSARNLSGCEGYVLNMHTLPAWRRRGIASTILQRLLVVASERGCRRVSMHALPQGRSIYLKAGFVSVDMEMRLTLPARDEQPEGHLRSPQQACQIQPFTVTDYDDVIAFWKQQAGVGLNESDERDRIALFLDRNRGLSFVVRDGGRVVGAVLCGHDGRRGYLHHLAVASSHRKQGIGKELVQLCLKRLHEAGIQKCNIFLFDGNSEGEGFWRAVRFQNRPDLKLMQRATH